MESWDDEDGNQTERRISGATTHPGQTVAADPNEARRPTQRIGWGVRGGNSQGTAAARQSILFKTFKSQHNMMWSSVHP